MYIHICIYVIHITYVYVYKNITKPFVFSGGAYEYRKATEKTNERNVPEKTFSFSLELKSVTIRRSKKVMNHF